MNTAPKLTVMSDTRFMPAAATPAIEVLSAEKIYSNGTRALLPVNLTINQGEFITLLGPSGCGKSTLLKMVAGLVEPSDGKLMLWRRDSREKAQHPLSFVFQEATLMPWSSVRNNVRLPLDLAGVPRAEGNTRVNEVLELVGLGKFADVLPRELSGGMQIRQRPAASLAGAKPDGSVRHPLDPRSGVSLPAGDHDGGPSRTGGRRYPHPRAVPAQRGVPRQPGLFPVCPSAAGQSVAGQPVWYGAII